MQILGSLNILFSSLDLDIELWFKTVQNIGCYLKFIAGESVLSLPLSQNTIFVNITSNISKEKSLL